MTTVYAREEHLSADEYIDVVAKSGLNRPIEDRARVERMLANANLFVTARQDGRLVGFARSLTDFCFCCYLSDLAVDKACQGQGIGKRLIEETRAAAGGSLTTTLLLSAPTAVSFYKGIRMPQADNCFLYGEPSNRTSAQVFSYPQRRGRPRVHPRTSTRGPRCRTMPPMPQLTPLSGSISTRRRFF
jgi:GNAT superfamily N-acetyltransferase